MKRFVTQFACERTEISSKLRDMKVVQRQSSFGISGTVFYKLCSQVLTRAALRTEQLVAACSRLKIPHKFGTDRRRQDLQGAARNGQSQPSAIRSSSQQTDTIVKGNNDIFFASTVRIGL